MERVYRAEITCINTNEFEIGMEGRDFRTVYNAVWDWLKMLKHAHEERDYYAAFTMKESTEIYDRFEHLYRLDTFVDGAFVNVWDMRQNAFYKI